MHEDETLCGEGSHPSGGTVRRLANLSLNYSGFRPRTISSARIDLGAGITTTSGVCPPACRTRTTSTLHRQRHAAPRSATGNHYRVAALFDTRCRRSRMMPLRGGSVTAVTSLPELTPGHCRPRILRNVPRSTTRHRWASAFTSTTPPVKLRRHTWRLSRWSQRGWVCER